MKSSKAPPRWLLPVSFIGSLAIFTAVGDPWPEVIFAAAAVAVIVYRGVWLIKYLIPTTHGTVLSHEFSPAGLTPEKWVPARDQDGEIYMKHIPRRMKPAEWRLELYDGRDRSRWVTFHTNVHNRFPVGSVYTEP